MKMTHTYNVSGMTCTGCQTKVQSLLSKVKGVKNVAIDLGKGEVTIDMDKHIGSDKLKNALRDYPKYQLEKSNHNYPHASTINLPGEETKSWFETYKPILLIFGYILGVTVLIEIANGAFNLTRWIEHFMAGFFLVFSFSNYLI